MMRLLSLALALTSALAFAGQVQAAVYGDYMDPSGTVAYENVMDVNGLYGAPSVSANSLDFTPTTFDAACSGGCPTNPNPGQTQVTDTLTLDILASQGMQITEVAITEGLDYQLQAFGVGAFASVTVVANVFVDVFEVDQVSINSLSDSYQLTFNPSNSFFVDGPTGIDGGLFNGALNIDIQSILAANGVMGNATGVRISFDNTLQAFHSGGGQSLIRKRDTDFVSLTIEAMEIVPEPGTALLLMGGLALLSARRR